MKKRISLLLALAMVLSLCACQSRKEPTSDGTVSAAAAATGGWGSELHWNEYDELINRIRTTTGSPEERTQMLHEAEDRLMETWCIAPIYYYKTPYMLKNSVSGIYENKHGVQYLYKAELPNGRDSLNVCLCSEPGHLDPALITSREESYLVENSFEGLMTCDEDGQLQCGQAENYEVSDDGLTYTFTMREGLKWSNGDDLTAKDFEYSWRRAADPATAADYGYLFEVLADCQYDDQGNFTGLGEHSVEASEDGKTLTVHLEAICPYFLDLCAFHTFYPVYQPSVEATATAQLPSGTWANDAGDQFVCNGPFALKSWNHDSDMTYVRNENYWGAASIHLNTINLMLTSDDTVAYNAYNDSNGGESSLDMTTKIPNDELGKLMASGNPELHVADTMGTYYVGFNYNSKLYEELGLNEEEAKVFRHALCLLIDREYIIDNIAQTGQQPATTIVPATCVDGTFKTKDYYSADDYEANVEEAKSLLESIGLWDGTKLTKPIAFDYMVNKSDLHVKTAEALQQDWGQIGIEVTIKTEEWNVFLEDRKKGNYDVARMGWYMDFDDPINILEMWTTASGNNDCQFGRVVG